MSRLLRAAFLGAALLCANALATESAVHAARVESTPEDIAAIRQVTVDFQEALKTRDIKRLSSLMLNSNILFASPAPPEGARKVRATIDVNFDGVTPGGYPGFAESIETRPGAVEERFYNIRITQDRHVAVVVFDFDFLRDAKVINHGIEIWQMLKAHDGKWKIVSVYWSSKGPPKQGA